MLGSSKSTVLFEDSFASCHVVSTSIHRCLAVLSIVCVQNNWKNTQTQTNTLEHCILANGSPKLKSQFLNFKISSLTHLQSPINQTSWSVSWCRMDFSSSWLSHDLSFFFHTFSMFFLFFWLWFFVFFCSTASIFSSSPGQHHRPALRCGRGHRGAGRPGGRTRHRAPGGAVLGAPHVVEEATQRHTWRTLFKREEVGTKGFWQSNMKQQM